MQPNVASAPHNAPANPARQRGAWIISGPERPQPVAPLLERFEPISLAELDAVALMDRTDTKYVLGMPQLRAVLAALCDDYRVLETGGVRLSHYRTLYFDTEFLELYADHHAGRLERFKVRSRAYLDTGVSFLEVKHKTNKGRTVKERIQTDALLTQLTPSAREFVHEHLLRRTGPLQAALWSEFSRITLVGKERPERVTLDLDLRFRVQAAGLSLPGVVIAEVKQEGVNRESGLMVQLRALGIRPTNFSKYCIGTALLHPEVKHNRFKPVMRSIGVV